MLNFNVTHFAGAINIHTNGADASFHLPTMQNKEIATFVEGELNIDGVGYFADAESVEDAENLLRRYLSVRNHSGIAF